MKYIYLLALSGLLLSCSENKKHTPVIRGKLQPKSADYLLLKQKTDIERKITRIIDTLFVAADGSFQYDVSLEPYTYVLEGGKEIRIPLAIDRGQQLKITVKNGKAAVTGSKDTDLLYAYEAFRKKSLDSLVQSVRRQIRKLRKSENPDREKIQELTRLEVENYKKHIAELNAFIKKKMGTSIALYDTSIRWSGEENLKFYDSLVTAFEKVHPGLALTAKLREKVTRLQQTSIGGTAPDIKMPSPDGTPESLYGTHKKYTLIDFWASWCGPCRTESAGLLKLYEKYKQKGFEIYGVSLDSKRGKWLNAIKKDRRVWTNVSTLEGFKTPAAFDFTVTALPMNFLIDSEHKIIAKNLHIDELEAILDNLLAEKP